ncbi:MAG: SDR family oxidoreductase, partial [Verrucomicrobiota bacterium]
MLEGEAGRSYIETAIKKKESQSLAQLWVKGVAIDWHLLYEEGYKPNKISLPTYPFARERYWIPTREDEERAMLSLKKSQWLHPLIHSNESDLLEQKYLSVFSGSESFLSDHQFQDTKVLPGVAYLEMAREAGTRSTHRTITGFRDVRWLRPLRVNGQPVSVQTAVFENKETVAYEIYSTMGKEEEILHGEGKLCFDSFPPRSPYDIAMIRDRLTHHIDGGSLYDFVKKLGAHLGGNFQNIAALWYNQSEALSKINRSKEAGFSLQPSILDVAPQTFILGLTNLASEDFTPQVPFSVREVAIYGDINESFWCYARRSDDTEEATIPSYDVELLSASGDILVAFKDFLAVSVEGMLEEGVPKSRPEALDLCYYLPQWSRKTITSGLATSSLASFIVLAGGSVPLAEVLTDRLGCEVQALEASDEMGYYARLQELIQSRLGGNVRTKMLVVYPNQEMVRYGFISGLLKTATLEHPTFLGKTIGVDSLSIQEVDALATLLEDEQAEGAAEVRYKGDHREVKEILSLDTPTTSSFSIKEGGVYLITGGAGGLGRLFAEYLARTKDTKLILTGRREESPISEEALSTLHATYHSCDVTNEQAITQVIEGVLDTHGRLDGIIHSAGVIKDGFLVKKTGEEAAAVLSPKIAGVKHLDEATKELDLDFMVYCSSLAGVRGNVGQADYASANAFMDDYAHHRNALVREGQRQGKTLSINWPLWQEGGMQVDAESEHYLERKWGMQGLPTQEGMKAFEVLLQHDSAQGIVVYGQPSKINQKLLRSVKKSDLAATASAIDTTHLQSETEKVIVKLASELLKLDASKVSVHKA